MARQLLSLCLGSVLLAAWPAPDAGAEDLPVRKVGLWEMKIPGFMIAWRGPREAGKTDSSPTPGTIQHCTDETIDRQMNSTLSPMANQACSRNDIRKTATGYVSDSVCSVAGMSITSHAEISGDFNSAYTVKSTSHTDRGPATAPRDSTATIEAKWLGACKPDQKPGDILMPGGVKMNIRDMENLKAMIPKQLPK